MPEPSFAVVQRQLDAYNRGDLELFLQQYTIDVVQSRPDGSGALRGMAEFRDDYAARFARALPRCSLLGRLTIGNWVVDHEHVEGMGAVPARTGGAAFHVRDGLIDRVVVLDDSIAPQS